MYSMQMMHAIIILASFDGMQSHQESSDATIPLFLKTIILLGAGLRFVGEVRRLHLEGEGGDL